MRRKRERERELTLRARARLAGAEREKKKKEKRKNAHLHLHLSPPPLSSTSHLLHGLPPIFKGQALTLLSKPHTHPTHAGSHVSDNDPATIRREKAKSLEGHTPTVMPGAPGWNEKLASDSEAVVKAERAAAEAGVPSAPACPGEDVAGDVKVLARHTVAVLREQAFVDRLVEQEVQAGAEAEDPLTRGSSPL